MIAPKIFEDRTSADWIKRDHPELYDALRARDLLPDSKKNSIKFCGLLTLGNGQQFMFVPRSALQTPSVDDLSIAKLTMQALYRYGNDSNRACEGVEVGEVEDSTSILGVVADLTNDFLRHGLLQERVRERTVSEGKIHWQKTIIRKTPFRSMKGGVVYFEFESSRLLSQHDECIALIQASVLKEISDVHSWWMPALRAVGNELVRVPSPRFPRSDWPRVLRMRISSLYSSRAIHLVNLLVKYLENEAEENKPSNLYGLKDFHTVWEAMLRKVLLGVESGWNARLPVPAYVQESGEKERPSRGMQTDIILRDGGTLNVLDAKYYAARSAQTVPGWADIVKQMFYEFAVKSVDSSLSVYNWFVFPCHENLCGRYAVVKMVDRDGEDVNGFPKINCAYMSVVSVMDAYVNGLIINFDDCKR